MASERRFLALLLDIDKTQIKDIRRRSVNIFVSQEEENIISKYSFCDAFAFDFSGIFKDGFGLSIDKVVKNKIRHYKFFVQMYEDYGCLPNHVKNYMNLSFCGRAKIRALEYRFGEDLVQENLIENNSLFE